MNHTTTDSVLPTIPENADHATCETFHAHPDVVARLREALIGGGDVATLADTFRILGDITRVRILDALSHAELCVCDLATLLDLSESAVSHQLRLLRGMRLVRPRRDGRMVFYALDDQHITRLFQEGLGHVGETPDHLPRAVAGRRSAASWARGGIDGGRAADEDADHETVPRGNVE
jgi:DNA-binding transcriptional ArsR family regulator